MEGFLIAAIILAVAYAIINGGGPSYSKPAWVQERVEKERLADEHPKHYAQQWLGDRDIGQGQDYWCMYEMFYSMVEAGMYPNTSNGNTNAAAHELAQAEVDEKKAAFSATIHELSTKRCRWATPADVDKIANITLEKRHELRSDCVSSPTCRPIVFEEDAEIPALYGSSSFDFIALPGITVKAGGHCDVYQMEAPNVSIPLVQD